MTCDNPPDDPTDGPEVEELTLEQLRGLQYGVAAVLMPVGAGWRIHYFSIPSFEDEPGKTFPTFAAAIDALEEVLPFVNSKEHREEAADELRQRIRESHQADRGDASP